MTVQQGGRQLLLHGIAFVIVGFVWGFVVHLAPYPRLALGAHLQFLANGALLMIQALMLLMLPHNVGPRSLWVMVLAAWLTWAMALSQAANAYWGTAQVLVLAASQAGVSGGSAWQEWAVLLASFASGGVLVPAWMLLLIGFVRRPTESKST